MQFWAGDGAPRVLRVWIAATGVAATAFCGLIAGLFTPWLLVLCGLTALLTVFLFWWFPGRYADSVHGSFDGTAVRATKGVLWRRQVFIPMNALRTFELLDTPVQRHFGCRTMLIRFAGGTAVLLLLSWRDAERLEKLLEEAEN